MKAAIISLFGLLIAAFSFPSFGQGNNTCGYLACEQWIANQTAPPGSTYECRSTASICGSSVPPSLKVGLVERKVDGLLYCVGIGFPGCNCASQPDINTEFYNTNGSFKKCVSGCQLKLKTGGENAHVCTPMNNAQPTGYQFCTGTGMTTDGGAECNPISNAPPPDNDPPPEQCEGDTCVEHKPNPPQICMQVEGRADVCVKIPEEVGTCKGNSADGYICAGTPPPAPPPPPETRPNPDNPTQSAPPSTYTTTQSFSGGNQTTINVSTYHGGSSTSGPGTGGNPGTGEPGTGGSNGGGGTGGQGGQGGSSGSGGQGGAGGDGGDGGAGGAGGAGGEGGEGGKGGDAKSMCEGANAPPICEGVELCKGEEGDPAFCKGICDAGSEGGQAPAFCSNACDGESPPGYCSAICEQQGAENGLMCKGLCEGDDTKPFCKTLCQQDDAPGFCQNDASGGETCAAPPTCAGDSVACAILKQTWETRCAIALEEPQNPDEGTEYTVADVTGEEDQSGIWSQLDAGGFLGGGGSCPQLPTVAFMGNTFEMAEWIPCDILAILATLILVAGYAQAAFIIGRG